MSVSSSKLTRRPWNEQEDAALLKLIEKFGCIGCWPNIARLMKSRTGKQCRERYINHLDPNTKKSPWTLLEDDIIRELYPSLNTKWSQYMSRLPGRTDNAIKNRYHAITRRNFNYYDAGHTDCSASVVSTGDKRSMAETVVEEYTDEAGEEPQAKRARVLQSASAVRSVPVRALRTLSSVSDLTTNQAESETTSSFSMDDFDFDKIAVEVAVIETEEEVLKKNLSSTDLDFEELLNDCSMEVIASNAGLLTNVEVLDIMRDNRSKRSTLSGVKVELQGRELVETKAIKYITGKAIGSVSGEAVEQCLKEIKQLNLGLTEGELVQIVNLAPRSEVEYYLIIEDCQERCSEDQLASITTIITRYFFPNEMAE